jgi:uncharacterized protein (DUF362 family)/Pyruvate/2-oxoacid:ferredoxin oxidoreductase delta subunit
MSKVIVRKADYNYKTLKPAVFEIMDAAGGDMIQNNSRVVIKPNLLAPAPSHKAMVTHPLIIKATVEYVLDRGAKPQISDSPPYKSIDSVLQESGIKAALHGLDVTYRDFISTVRVDIGAPFRKIEIAEDALTADFLINLPKLKTHTQMLMTLAVKNLFGCIVGPKKAEWHFRAGVDIEMFATLLFKIYRAVNPSMTIMDGILAMEGQGPGSSGEPRELGVLIGGRDALSIDIAVCNMLGIKPEMVLTNKVARDHGHEADCPLIEGHLPEIHNFKLPVITPAVFGPEWLHGFVRRHITRRPVCDSNSCRHCGDCWKYCPAHAITADNKTIHFDYDTCIRCYCCIEVCPHGALRSRETLSGRITRKLLNM